MADEILEVEARLKDFISGNLQTIENNIKNFSEESSRSFEKPKESWFEFTKGFLASIGVIEGLKKIKEATIDLAIESVKKYDESAIAVAKLTQAIGYESKALIEQSEIMQKNTRFDNDEVIAAQAMLAMYIKNEDALKKLTPAIADFAAAKGIGLTEASTAVVRAFEGEGNAMQRYGLHVTGASGSTEKFNSILSELNSKFGGQAEVIGNSGAGAFIKLKHAIDDVEKGLGAALMPSLNKFAEIMINDVVPVLESAVKAFDKWLNPQKSAEMEHQAAMINEYQHKIIDLRNEIASIEKVQKTAWAIVPPGMDVSAKHVRALKAELDSYLKDLEQMEKKSSGPKADEKLVHKETSDEKEKRLKAERDIDKALKALWEKEANENYKDLEARGKRQEELEKRMVEDEIKLRKQLEAQWAREDQLQTEYAEKERARKQQNIENGFAMAQQSIATLQTIGQAAHANSQLMKRLAQGQAIINTAQAITGILAHSGDAGLYSVPFAIALSALVGAQGLAQVALIEQQQFAKGGQARSGMALVGEQGPELVKFNQPGYVYNNRETQSKLGGTTMNFHFAPGTTSAIKDDIAGYLMAAERSGKLEPFKKKLAL